MALLGLPPHTALIPQHWGVATPFLDMCWQFDLYWLVVLVELVSQWLTSCPENMGLTLSASDGNSCPSHLEKLAISWAWAHHTFSHLPSFKSPPNYSYRHITCRVTPPTWQDPMAPPVSCCMTDIRLHDFSSSFLLYAHHLAQGLVQGDARECFLVDIVTRKKDELMFPLWIAGRPP